MLELTVFDDEANQQLLKRPINPGDEGLVIGRGPSPDIALPGAPGTVSKRHLALRLEGASLILTDISTNGTRLSDRELIKGVDTEVSIPCTLFISNFRLVVSKASKQGQKIDNDSARRRPAEDRQKLPLESIAGSDGKTMVPKLPESGTAESKPKGGISDVRARLKGFIPPADKGQNAGLKRFVEPSSGSDAPAQSDKQSHTARKQAARSKTGRDLRSFLQSATKEAPSTRVGIDGEDLSDADAMPQSQVPEPEIQQRDPVVVPEETSANDPLELIYKELNLELPAKTTEERDELARVLGSLLFDMFDGYAMLLDKRQDAIIALGINASTYQSTQNPLKANKSTELALAETLGSMVAAKDAHGFVDDAIGSLDGHHASLVDSIMLAIQEVMGRFEPDALSGTIEEKFVHSVVPATRDADLWRLFVERHQDLRNQVEWEVKTVIGKAITDNYQRSRPRCS